MPQGPPTLKSATAYIVRKDTKGFNTKTTKHESGGEQACHRCGTKGHTPQNCRFKTQTCHFCKGQGHISRVCWKRMQSRDSEDATRGKGKPQTTHHVDEKSLIVVYSISDDRGVTVEMDIAGRQIKLEIDTGATVTVIPTSTYQKNLKHIQLRPSRTRLHAYNGQPLNVQGEAEVTVGYKEQQVNVKFHVVEVKNKPAILGRDCLKHSKLDWDSIFTVQKFQAIDPVQTFPQLLALG